MKTDNFSSLWKFSSLMMIATLVLTACAATTSIPASATALPPTQTATPTLIPTPTPVTALLLQYPAHAVVDEQTWNEIQQNQFIQEQIKLWQEWIDYWAYAEIPAIPLDTPLQLDFVFDPTNLPKDKYDGVEKKVNVTLNWKGTNGEPVSVYFPIDSAETDEENGVVFQSVPPKLNVVEPGTEPLFLSGNIVWRGNEWIRVNASGKKIEQIQRMSPFGWEAFDPGKRLREMLSIVYSEEHVYTFPESGVTLQYSLQTDESKGNEPIGLNVGGFPKAEETMAWAISDAIFRSVWRRNHPNAITPTEADYQEFMRRWAEYQRTGVLPADLMMKVKAYVDGEKSPREIEISVPNYSIPIVFAEQNEMERVDQPVYENNDTILRLTNWIYMNDGQITLVSGSSSINLTEDKPANDETLGLAHSLSGFLKNNGYIYADYLYTSYDGNGKEILRVVSRR